MVGEVGPNLERRKAIIRALHREEEEPCIIMGILNTTPDSFHSESRQQSVEEAIENGLKMIEQGATWLDIGGESTRPGADFVDVEEELARVIPVIEGLRQRSECLISIDTRRWQVAKSALEAGADLVNDVSGLRDPAMVDVVLKAGCAVCIMHMQGEPGNMQSNPIYDNCALEISENLLQTARGLIALGHDKDLICLDPGIGFGKTLEHNIELLQNHDLLRGIEGFSILWGVSRKSMIGQLTGNSQTQDRLSGTLGVAAIGQQEGIDILRVHDVKEHHDLLTVMNALD